MKNNSTYLMRSLLFVPGHIEKYMNSALTCGADVLIPDIEDSVPGKENKKLALENIINYAKAGKFDGLKVFPRVNEINIDTLKDELWRLAIPGISGFMIPKIRTSVAVHEINSLLTNAEFDKGLEHGTFKLIFLIETAAAVMNIMKICKASRRIIAVAFGSEDFLNDLGGRMDPFRDSIFTARAMISMAAKANGIQPIDTVHTDVFDFNGLHNHCNEGAMLGYDGMLALNPKELPIIHNYYSPGKDDIEYAREIISLSEEATSAGRGVAIMDGKFIGPPMVAAARKVLDKNDRIKSITTK